MASGIVQVRMECLGGPWDGEVWEISVIRASRNPIAQHYHVMTRGWVRDSYRHFQSCLVWDPA